MQKTYSYEEALTVVDTLCRAILGRPAEGEGWTRYAEALASGARTEEDMGAEFIMSPEFHARGRHKALSRPSHEPVLIQTADPVVYREMLDATSRTVIAYCQRHNLKCESYVGIKRGVWPWHATYNRIFILKELMDRGFRGWAVYLDADAYIVDQSFDLRQYLADKDDIALIAALALGHANPSTPGNGPHKINAGVFLLNLGHPVGRALVAEWHRRYLDIPEYIVRQADTFDVGMDSDQALLCDMLAENQHYLSALRHENWGLLNGPSASFIRQQLRAMHASMEERLAAITTAVEVILASEGQDDGQRLGATEVRRGVLPPETLPPPASSSFRVPRALRVTEISPPRVLVVGSCFSETLLGPFRAAGCECDFVLFNNVGQLPAAPPQPLTAYDFQVVQIPLRSVLPEMAYFRAIGSDVGWDATLAEAQERLRHLLDAAMGWNREMRILTFALNFLAPQENPLGRTQPRTGKRNMARLVQQLNDDLDDAVQTYLNSYVVDCDELSGSFGRRYVQDDVYMQLNHAGVLTHDGRDHDMDRLQTPSPVKQLYPNRSDAYTAAVIEEMLALHRTMRGVDAVKLVIVDLDDTLWRGLVVENWRGAGHASEGYPLGLAEALLYLKARGIVLAIVSKNDPEKIAQVWPHVWHGRLSLDDFAVREINWRPKPENVEAVIRAVNVRPDSVVFIDDNPVERAAVQAAFPDIRVLGEEPFLLRRILLASPETQAAAITEESARRTEMVRAQVAREDARVQMSRDEFLAALNVRIALTEIRSPTDPHFARCLELINKTNQFNTTGRRLTLEACSQALAEGTVLYAFEVEDKFVHYGLVGAALVRVACIEQFVMSCRVMGLDVELQVIAKVVESIWQSGCGTVSACVTETGANHPCLDLFKRCGFTFERGLWIYAGHERRAADVTVRTGAVPSGRVFSRESIECLTPE
ncbi:MAG: HAD-IIIC family phosphatase [Caulobacteraceae bacterium]